MISQPTYRRSVAGDDGIAMVLSLLFMLLLSALGTAMLVMSRSETLSSVNYRMMSQARYGAESGVHKAANFLLSNSYAKPATTGSDPLSNFDTTYSPVRYGGQPVVLSSLTGVTGNYPLASAQTAFATATQGTLAVGDATVIYTASATLLSMRSVVPYASLTPIVVQTWRLTARGAIQGARQAEVEVSAVIEQKIVPTFTYGLFAVTGTCGALDFSGGVVTDSYDSSNMTFSGGLPVTTPSGGHVATNGNLNESGGSVVKGSLSTPRVGVGNCASGAVTALDPQGNNSVVQAGINKLPQNLVFGDPDLPSPMPPTNNVGLSGSATCASIPMTSPSCTLIAGVGQITLTPQGGSMTLPNIQISGGTTIVLNAGTYNINSLKMTGNSILKIGSSPVILNVAGVGEGTPIDLEGGSVTNTSFNPYSFRILYAGTGTLKLTGGNALAASVYAPKGYAQIAGGANFYGSAVAGSVKLTGGAKMHFDYQQRQFFGVGPQMMSVFTWKEY